MLDALSKSTHTNIQHHHCQYHQAHRLRDSISLYVLFKPYSPSSHAEHGPAHNSIANQVGMYFYPGVLGMTDKLTAPTAFYSTILYWSMLEIGFSVIAACLPTLAPLFRDVPTEQINKLMRDFFTLPSRSSGTVASVSETRIVRETDAENYWGIESYAMGDTDGQHGEGGGQGRETNGRILITTGISRHSSIDSDEV